jgi:hypothetical protein
LDEDISEIMQKEGSDNDSQTGDEAKENERPAKRMRNDDSNDNSAWENSDINFLVETPVGNIIIFFKYFNLINFFFLFKI